MFQSGQTAEEFVSRRNTELNSLMQWCVANIEHFEIKTITSPIFFNSTVN